MELLSPPPQEKKNRKELDNVYVHFQRVFVEFVVISTKIWPTIMIFRVAAKCWREGCLEGCWPHPPFTPRIGRRNFSCSFS